MMLYPYDVGPQISVPGLKHCRVSAVWTTVLVDCEPEAPEEDVEYTAALLHPATGASRTLSASAPVFRFEGVRPNAAYTINVSVQHPLGERRLTFSQVISVKERVEAAPEPTERTLLYDDQMLEKLLPLVGTSGVLIFTFIIVMIVISIVRRSRDLFKDKTLHTHIAFSQGIDQVFYLSNIENKSKLLVNLPQHYKMFGLGHVSRSALSWSIRRLI